MAGSTQNGIVIMMVYGVHKIDIFVELMMLNLSLHRELIQQKTNHIEC